MKNGNIFDRSIYWLRTGVLILTTLLIISVVYIFISVPGVDPLNEIPGADGKRIQVPFPGNVEWVDADGNLLFRSNIHISNKQTWIAINDIPSHLLSALIAFEDNAFFRHNGVDLNQIYYAFWENILSWRFKYGASTITQQLVKNRYLNRDKNLLRKIREILLALRTEKQLSKQQILEWYINIIEMAPGVFGIFEGSHYYFNKHPRDLNFAEQIFIAGIVPSPERFASFPEEAVMKVEQLAGKLFRLHKINYSQYKYLQQVKYKFSRDLGPDISALHILLNNQFQKSVPGPQEGWHYTIETTLSAPLQKKAASIAASARIPGMTYRWLRVYWGERTLALAPVPVPDESARYRYAALFSPWPVELIEIPDAQLLAKIMTKTGRKPVVFCRKTARWSRQTEQFTGFLPKK